MTSKPVLFRQRLSSPWLARWLVVHTLAASPSLGRATRSLTVARSVPANAWHARELTRPPLVLPFRITSIAACYLGGGSRYSNQISAGATFAFLAVTIILLVSPRGESYKSDIEEEISGYDQTVTQRALMMVSMVGRCMLTFSKPAC